MDRQIVYPGQILPETSLLQMAKDAMIGSAKLAAAVLGTSTIANGFAVTPTGPASLQVVVAPGEIYSLTSIDALAFSTLPADTTHSIMKQGILLDAVTLTCAAPTTTGQSINYLVQATYQDVDSTPVLLPYYNSANPSLPFSGMGNNGLTQNTSRKGGAVVAVKAGVSATTGSQATPAPDAGYVGLQVVTVAYGQTTITSTSISQYASAPLLPSGLLQSIQSGNTAFAIDTGVANAYVCNFTPALTARSESMPLRFKVKTTSTGACTINDGLGVVPLVGGAHSALQNGELFATGDALILWNTSVGGGSYILLMCTGAPEQVANATQSQHAVPMGQIQAQAGTAFTTGGTAPAFTLTPVPAITALAAGQRFRASFNAAGTTGSNTLNVNGTGAKNLLQFDQNGNLQSANITSGLLTDVEYNGTSWVVLDPLPIFTRQLQSISASTASNALTFRLDPTSLDFRSATLSLGTINTRSIPSALFLTVPSGATLGTISATAARIVLLAIDNAGTVELAVVNLSGGNNLDETTLISTTAISASATAANVIYSTTARTNVPFRVVGFIDITESTAGTWATAPSRIQGAGGQVITALSGFGAGQAWQNLTSSRGVNINYTNTTGRTIYVAVTNNSSPYQVMSIYVDGIAVMSTNTGGAGYSQQGNVGVPVPPGSVYQVQIPTGALYIWQEFR